MNTYFKDIIPATLPEYHLFCEMGGYDRYKQQVRVQIFRRAPGSVVNPPVYLGAGSDPVEIQMSLTDSDFFRPIIGAQARISIQADVFNRFFEMFDGDDLRYKVEIYENYGTLEQRLIFFGYIRNELTRQEYGSHTPVVHLYASDGLALLKDREFDPGDGIAVFDAHPIGYILSYLLSLVGNDRNWTDAVRHTWYTVESEANVGWGFIEMPTADFYGMSCYDVLLKLMDILKTNICLKNGKYHVREIDAPQASSQTTYDRFGDFVSLDSRTMVIHEFYSKYYGGRGGIHFMKAPRKLTITQVDSGIPQLLFNGEFEKNIDGWTSSETGGEFVYWREKMMEMTPLWVAPNFQDKTDIEYENPYDPFSVYVQAEIQRRLLTRSSRFTRLRVEFEIKVTRLHTYNAGALGPVTTGIRYGEYNAENRKTTHNLSGEEWHTISHDHIISIGNPYELVIYARIVNWAHPDDRVQIRNVSCHAMELIKGELQKIEDKTEKLEHMINSDSLTDLNFTLTHRSKNEHEYYDALPTASISRKPSHYEGAYFSTLLDLVMQDRIKTFYEKTRMRWNMSCLAKSGTILHPDTVIQETRLKKTFIFSSYKYYPISKNIAQADLIEYAGMLLKPQPPPPGIPWILETGKWNDTGVWKDTSKWNDGI